MTIDAFRKGLTDHFDEFRRALATDAGDWTVKGFIMARAIDSHVPYHNLKEYLKWRCIGKGKKTELGL